MFALVNGILLYYTQTGQGSPVLLLHGNGEDHTIFNELTATLAEHHTVYRLDSRCHGKSSSVPELHYADMAEDVAEFIRIMCLDKPLVYGFSDGGIVGLILASRFPDLLGKLAVSGANFTPQGVKPLFADRLKWQCRFHPKDQKLQLMRTEPNLTRRELQAIRVPTLIMVGSRDIIRPAHTQLLAQLIPNAQLLVLPGETHGSYVVHSDKVYAAMKNFVDG